MPHSTAPTTTTGVFVETPEQVMGMAEPSEHYVPVLAEVLAEIAAVQDQVEELLAAGRSPLPAEPDLDTIGPWSVAAHRRHWGWS